MIRFVVDVVVDVHYAAQYAELGDPRSRVSCVSVGLSVCLSSVVEIVN